MSLSKTVTLSNQFRLTIINFLFYLIQIFMDVHKKIWSRPKSSIQKTEPGRKISFELKSVVASILLWILGSNNRYAVVLPSAT